MAVAASVAAVTVSVAEGERPVGLPVAARVAVVVGVGGSLVICAGPSRAGPASAGLALLSQPIPLTTNTKVTNTRTARSSERAKPDGSIGHPLSTRLDT